MEKEFYEDLNEFLVGEEIFTLDEIKLFNLDISSEEDIIDLAYCTDYLNDR